MLIRYALAAKALSICLIASPAYAPTLAPLAQPAAVSAAAAMTPAVPLAR